MTLNLPAAMLAITLGELKRTVSAPLPGYSLGTGRVVIAPLVILAYRQG